MQYRIRQVEENRHYRGNLKIGAGVFKFDMRLKEPLSSRGASSHIFPGKIQFLVIEKNGLSLNLDENSKGFFWHLIFKMVEHMRAHPLVKETVRKVRKAAQNAAKKSLGGVHVVRVCIDLEQTERIELPISTSDKVLLNSLGCNLK